MVFNFAYRRNLGHYWIDANDKATEGLWVDSDGNRTIYKYESLNIIEYNCEFLLVNGTQKNQMVIVPKTVFMDSVIEMDSGMISIALNISPSFVMVHRCLPNQVSF